MSRDSLRAIAKSATAPISRTRSFRGRARGERDAGGSDRGLGAKPDAPVDERERAQKEQEAQRDAARKQRIAEAGGQLVASAFRLLGELLPPSEGTSETEVGAVLRDQLAGAIDTDATGRPVLTLTLPDRSALDGMAQLLGRLLARAAGAQPLLN